MKKDDIVKEALSWCGTRWQHQTCCKGVATDCVGLAKGIYINLTSKQIEAPSNYSATWHLFKSDEVMYQEAMRYCMDVGIDNMQEGDLFLFAFGKGPAHHVGIYIGEGNFVHAWADIGKVSISSLDGFWEKHLRYVLRFKEVE